MKVLYFAWVRERTGVPEEQIDPPASVRTVGELMTWLRARGPEYEHAFERPEVIRAALDHEHVSHDTPLGAARELAFFPPMTGG